VIYLPFISHSFSQTFGSNQECPIPGGLTVFKVILPGLFVVRDKHRLHSQIYVTDFSPNKQIEKVIFLTKTPKFFFLQGNHNIIFEEGFNLRLDNFL
jgi:hypothetical protein